MKTVAEHFSNVPPAAMAAFEAGRVRMEARLANRQISAHAEVPQPAPAAAPVAAADHTAALRAAHDRERLIRAAFTNASNLGLDHKIVDNLLDRGIAPDALGNELVRVYAENQKQKGDFRMNHVDSGSRVVSSFDDPANVLEAMSDAIAYDAIKNLNPSHRLPENGARKFLGMSAAELAKASLGRTGSNMRLSRVTDEALGNTTSDFPNILGTSANKVLLAAIEAAAPTYRVVAPIQNMRNFQPHNLVQSGDFPNLLEINEAGEVTRGSMSDSAEVAQLKSAGRTFGISRQAIINDELGAFTNLAMKAGQAVAAYENSVFWTVFNSNPTLATTSAAVFSTTHANLTASGTAISATSLGIGRAAMRVQKSLDNVPLNIAPAILAVPVAKETLAEQVLSPLIIPEASGNVVPQGLRSPSLSLVVEPLLDANSATAWYLLSAPSRGANFVCGRLAGAEAPRIRTASPLNVDGIEFQVLIDFYAAAIDYRFGYKNAGA